MIEISKNANQNYLGKIFRIESIEKHSNADRLQKTTVDFQNVITGMNAKVGDVYVYFPVESKINEKFLKFTNSFRETTLNEDTTQKGFFEKNCRVKAMKLRNENSCGYIVPVKIIEEFCGVTNLSEYEGKYFDTINGILMLEKYVAKRNVPSENKPKNGKVSKESLIVENQFHFHNDTENFRRNSFKVNPEDLITISYKVHGTSFIVSNLLIKKELNKFEKFIKILNEKVPVIEKYIPKISESEYGYIVSSRRVIKSVEGKTFNGNHFYDEDIWSTVGEEIKEKIPEGYTIYGEIVGFTNTGSSIQGEYDYGCKEKEHKIYVYRVTFTNPNGIVFNLNTIDSMNFCELVGLQFVPVFFHGKAKDVFPELSTENHWNAEFVKKLEERYNEKDCYLCFNKVPEEGIVIRKEDDFKSFEAYKLKSFRFLLKETEMNDKGNENLEDNN